jgi:hypothetical protein
MKNTALKVAGSLFLLVAVLHALRFYFGTVILVGGTEIPLMASFIGALICLFLAVWLFLVAKQP